jgi:putative ABC transport system permease protein
LFSGLFVVIVFYFAAGSFLYFRLFTDLQEESEKYKALFKIGLTEREMRKSASFQLAVLFFLPFFVAVVHTVCIMSGDLQYLIGPTVGTISGFMVVQLICFTIARQMYLKKMTELSGE